MAYSVLILDDDVDFNSLLTDIFEQADYIVTSITDPTEAFEVFKNTDYDLVVTDHKMPDISGAKFMEMIKRIKPEVPVIMVSGFMENDTIRSLISGGVGGVFLKPLNIFSLLDRTAELIDETKRLKQNTQSYNDASNEGNALEVEARGFPFVSFPCKSQASIDFAERLYNLRNFKSTLSLIGEPGTQFRLICEDIRNFYKNEKEYFIYVSPGSFDAEQVLAMVEEAKVYEAERVTCVLLDVESMTDAQKRLATVLSNCAGIFELIEMPLRTIFCANGDLDTLYDEGRIDEDLYILMGTAEVCVPPLRDCALDIAILAQQMVVDIIREKGMSTVSRFEASARDFLSKQSWDNNYEQLRSTVRQVMESNPSKVLMLSAVTSALQSVMLASPRARFEARLSRARVDYVRATLILLGGDKAKVAAFFGTDTAVVEAALK